MRAMRKGWKHIIDDRTYVYHERGRSFGSDKIELMRQGAEIINERYPEYKEAIRIFKDGEKINLARHAARMAFGNWQKNRIRRILYIMESGDIEWESNIRKVLDDGCENYLLTIKDTVFALYKFEKRTLNLKKRHLASSPAGYSRSQEMREICAAWIFAHDIDEIYTAELSSYPFDIGSILSITGCKLSLLASEDVETGDPEEEEIIIRFNSA